MRSRVAEELRQEQIDEMRRMTPSERVTLVRSAREDGIRIYMTGQKLDRETALKAIRRERQNGRRHSGCMIESLK